MIEYQDFFEKYASKEEVQRISKMNQDSILNPSHETADINQIMKRIVQALSNSTVNVSYALKFI